MRNAISKQNEKNRTTLETTLLAAGDPNSRYVARNDPFFDGGPASILDATVTKRSVSQTQADLQQRLGAKGYKLACPGGEDTTAPMFQDHTTEPRQKCSLSGHGASGTVWLGTYFDDTRLSAMVGF